MGTQGFGVRESLNGALLIQPQGKANGITAALNGIRKERKQPEFCLRVYAQILPEVMH